MKKALLITTAFALFAISSYGQNGGTNSIHLGAKMGLNYSNIYDSKNDEYDANGKFGFAAGGFLAIPIGRFLGIQPEVMYSQKGYKQSGSFLGSNYDFTRTSHYLDIPLLVSIKPTSVLTFQFGPQFSYLMRQKTTINSGLGTVINDDEFDNDNIRKNTLGAVVGVDFNFDKVVFGTRAGWDLQNNNGDGSSTNPRYKNVVVQATLGFRIF
ncbi:porin family protein [Emticicia sp. BO119]|uniref:porin family protein n=1 Tax=Emticicia sp. BO119 TaxID=2757768 RepID=UPI0015F04825|nr:porin family protein [Emticicia sp. BO119]MBA4849171.1 PorT family protein [Emticicia sp. BO119]